MLFVLVVIKQWELQDYLADSLLTGFTSTMSRMKWDISLDASTRSMEPRVLATATETYLLRMRLEAEALSWPTQESVALRTSKTSLMTISMRQATMKRGRGSQLCQLVVSP
eukprot:gb/GEZN01028987.1/.p2 GENE.gb/GEZN01028987.1/~~gb/GEZN01028987.1/.p2  ORF type:complete len:111 (-),score=2.91 gb/GEZN01028987.1/:133-465(-)